MYYLRAFWSPRQESAAECARRLHDTIAGLAGIDPRLGRWYRKGRSREAALRREIDTSNQEALQRLVTSGTFDTADLGFSIAMWNGMDVSLEATVGRWWPSEPTNQVEVRFNPAGATHRVAIERTTALSAARALIEAWDPDTVSLATNEMLDAQVYLPERPPTMLGWLTWFRNEPALSMPDLSLTPEEGGWLLSLGETIDDVKTADVLRAVSALRA